MYAHLLGIGASVLGSKILSHFTSQRIAIVHALPGRLRLKCTDWKDADVAHQLETVLLQHPTINNVSVSPITGSLLIEFNQSHLTMEELNEVIKIAVQNVGQVYSSQETKLMHRLKKTYHSVDQKLKQQTKGYLDVNSLLILLFILNGMGRFKKNKAFAASLFFWAYSLFMNQKDKPIHEQN